MNRRDSGGMRHASARGAGPPGVATPTDSLLVTAFEPFGTPGRPNRGANASEEVLAEWRARFPSPHRTLVLPVDLRAEILLARALQEAPAGVVATGEAGLDGIWDTTVEPWAEDRPVGTAGVDPRDGPAPLRLASGFAPSVPLLPGMERTSRIGAYWCNRVYFRILDWARWNPRPVVFLHFRVDGDRPRQVEHLAGVVAAMERAVVPPRGPAAGRIAVRGRRDGTL